VARVDQRRIVSSGRALAVIALLGLAIAQPLPLLAANGDGGLAHAIAVQERITDHLTSLAGVVGTGVGMNAAGRYVIQIYTVTPDVAEIPVSEDGLKLRRVVTGLVTARACQGTNNPTQRCNRPVPIGVSVGHPSITAGTIGARVRDAAGHVFVLSNNHVLANVNKGSIGDSALQPGPYDGGSDPADRIGGLYDFQPISFSANNTIDAAIAISSAANLGVSTLPTGYGTPSSSTVAAAVNMNVTKCGRTTGCTDGSVSAVNVTIDVCYEPAGPFGCKPKSIAHFVNQISIGPGAFSAGGDSGSLIVRKSDNRPVGLLFAGGDSVTFANPINAVLSRFSVTIDDGSAGDPAATVPGAPRNASATAGNAQATVAWQPPIDDGGSTITQYTATSTPGSKTCMWTTGPLTCTVTGLTNGTSYTFKVTATNSVGTGLPSSSSNAVTPTSSPSATVPGAPQNVTAVAGNTKAAVSWSAPASNGGSAISSYVATSTPGSKTCPWTTGPLTCTVSGLTNGTSYTFVVRATNSVGTGPASAPSNAVTPTAGPAVIAPETVIKPNATLGSSTIPLLIGWSASDLAGITKYQLQQSIDGGSFATVSLASPTQTSITLQRSPAHSYRYRVRATNGDGVTSSYQTGPSFVLNARNEKLSSISYTGTWTQQTVSNAYGGGLKYAKSSTARATFTFTGRSFAWVSTRNYNRGKAAVYVDGVLVTTIDLYHASAQWRRTVFTRNWSLSSSHTVEIRVKGTKNSSSTGVRVDLDAFVFLR
jgi:hypothetical protein